MSAEKPTLEMTRLVDAPKDLVFAAWTEEEHLKHWFVPQGFKTVLCEVDLRVGGSFRVHWEDKKGTNYPNIGVYTEITPTDRIAYVDSFDDEREDNVHTEVLVLFTEEDGKTRLTSISTFESKEKLKELLAMGMEQGWSMFMDQMSDYAAGLAHGQS